MFGGEGAAFERKVLRVDVVDVGGRCRGYSEEDLGRSFGHLSDPLAFQVSGFGFRGSKFGVRVSGLAHQVRGLDVKVEDLIWVLGFRVQVFGLKF